jgi:hypothetical protein
VESVFGAGMEALAGDFLARFGEKSEEEVLTYLGDLLEQNSFDDDDDIVELGETLAGFSEVFAALAPSAQLDEVRSLLRDAEKVQRDATVPAFLATVTTEEGSGSHGSGHLIGPLQEAVSRLNSLALSTSSASTSASSSCDEGGKAHPSVAERDAVATLRALCPPSISSTPPKKEAGGEEEDTFDAFLLHMLRVLCGGSLHGASDWLLNCEDIPAEVEAWAQQETRRRAEKEAEALEHEELRRQIVDRYHLQAVSSSDAGGKGKAARGPTPLVPASGDRVAGAAPRVRYRDGVAVTAKGEKFIVEKPPEWDGGSRGKVKLKGKRGVGWA